MRTKGSNGKQKGVALTAGLLILSKLKWLLVTLKVFKFGSTLISLILSLVTYAVIFGWEFGVALVYVLFVHEMGHLVAAKQKGIKTSPAIFIPFMGAVIGMKERPKDAATEAYVAYGGPLFGLFSTFPPLLLFQMTHQPIWGVTLLVGAMINLFNLIPVSPLDGGRIIGVLSAHIWLLGLMGLGVYSYFFPSPILFIILLFGVLSWWRRVREDFSVNRLAIDIEVIKEWKLKLQQVWEDLFYQSYTYGEDRLVNEVMKMHILREWERERLAEQARLQKEAGFKMPLIQDKRKLEHYRAASRVAMSGQMMAIVEQVTHWGNLQDILRQLDRNSRKIEEEQKRINLYYNATAKTKWITFGFYLLLAAALGGLFYYAQLIVPGSIY
jgi:Zn-dependent protease